MSMASVEETESLDCATPPPPSTTSTYRHLKPSPLFVFNAVLMILGSGGGSLLLRLYFVRGGHRMWLSTFIQVAAWPILLLPLFLSRHFLPATSTTPRRLHLLLPRPLAAASAIIGLLIALDSYLYAYGSSCLPLSTSSLLIASQLAFTAVFSLFIVRQRFTPFSFNAVVLLTLGPVVLSLGAGSDRPEGEAMSRYYQGFFMSIAAAALIGLVLPLVELAYTRTTVEMTYAIVIETQIVMGAFGTLFSLLGMLIDKDFQVHPLTLLPFPSMSVRERAVRCTPCALF